MISESNMQFWGHSSKKHLMYHLVSAYVLLTCIEFLFDKLRDSDHMWCYQCELTYMYIMVFPVFPNHMTTAMISLQLASFWILPQVNNVATYIINFILDQTQNFILDQTQWVACLFMVSESGLRIQCLQGNYFEVDNLEHL